MNDELLKNRAHIFMPFDAVKGFMEALREKEKLVVSKKSLSEDQKAEISEQLALVKKGQMVTVCFYEDGEYLTMSGMISKIDQTKKVLTVVKKVIAFSDLLSVLPLK